MPLYSYHCPNCLKDFAVFKKLLNYRELQLCSCGSTAEKVISAPMVAVDYPAYQSPATGKWVEGKKAHMEDLRASGCRLLEPGEQKDMQKRQKQQDTQLEKKLNTSVETIFSQIKG